MNESGDRLNLKEESQLSRLGEGLSRGALTALEDKKRKDGSYFRLAKRRSEGRKEGRREGGKERGRKEGEREGSKEGGEEAREKRKKSRKTGPVQSSENSPGAEAAAGHSLAPLPSTYLLRTLSVLFKCQLPC